MNHAIDLTTSNPMLIDKLLTCDSLHVSVNTHLLCYTYVDVGYDLASDVSTLHFTLVLYTALPRVNTRHREHQQ